MPLLILTCTEKNLIGVFISDLVLQILAYVAETERDFYQTEAGRRNRDRKGKWGFGLDAGRTNFLKNLICILRCGKRRNLHQKKQKRFGNQSGYFFIADVRS